MLRKPVVLITGASGEIGHGLIGSLANDADRPIITLDVKSLAHELGRLVAQEFIGLILDTDLLERILSEYEVDTVFHLAALLSTRSEFTPMTAHHVNVEGTMNLLEFAQKQGESHGRPVRFLYPSSIAAYGLPDAATKASVGKVTENEWTKPTTMYGCNKLYCEHMGRYYAKHYKQLAAEPLAGKVDFRCLRFPGLISAVTVPSGGTSDYAPEMIHAAAQGKPYPCFVRPDTRIPFMAMPDGVDALLRLAAAPKANRPTPSTTSARSTPPPRRSGRSCWRRFPTRRSPTRWTRKGRGSWTPGPPTSTTRRRGATGGTPRATTSSAPFPST